MSDKMKPVIVLPLKTVSPEDIQVLRENGLCVVEATDPASVRFLDVPISEREPHARAAIELCRVLLSEIRDGEQEFWSTAEIHQILVRAFTDGTPLASMPVQSVKTVEKGGKKP